MIDVSDIIPTPDYNRVPPYRELRERNTILRAMVDGEDLEILNMNKLPNHQAAAAEEHAAVVHAIESIILFFMTGRRKSTEEPARSAVAEWF